MNNDRDGEKREKWMARCKARALGRTECREGRKRRREGHVGNHVPCLQISCPGETMEGEYVAGLHELHKDMKLWVRND